MQSQEHKPDSSEFHSSALALRPSFLLLWKPTVRQQIIQRKSKGEFEMCFQLFMCLIKVSALLLVVRLTHLLIWTHQPYPLLQFSSSYGLF